MNNSECNCDEPCLKMDGNGGFICQCCGKPAARVSVTESEPGKLAKWARSVCDSDMDAEDMQ